MKRFLYIPIFYCLLFLFYCCGISHKNKVSSIAMDGSTASFKQTYNALFNIRQKLNQYEHELYYNEKVIQRENLDILKVIGGNEFTLLDTIINQCHELLKDCKTDGLRIKLYAYLGEAYYYREEYYTSLTYFKKLEKLSKFPNEYTKYWICKNQLNIGNKPEIEGGFEELKQTFTRKKNSLPHSIYALKAAYYQQLGYLDSVNYYLESAISLEKHKTLKYRWQIIAAKNYLAQKDTVRAIQHLKNILNSNVDDNIFIAASLDLAKLKVNSTKEINQSIKHLLNLYEGSNNAYYRNYLAINLADLYLYTDDKNAAVKYLEQIHDLSFFEIKDRNAVYHKLANLYELLGDSKKVDSLNAVLRTNQRNENDKIEFSRLDTSSLRFVNKWPDNKSEVDSKIQDNTYKELRNEISSISAVNYKEDVNELIKGFQYAEAYYFAIPIVDLSINLSSSRYNIGQFNRNNILYKHLQHQISKDINSCQLLLIGVFKSLDDVISYENRIVSLLPELIKVAPEKYATFVVRMDMVSSLKDDETLAQYLNWYNKNKRLLHNKDEERIKK